jgi:hypothetical protein
MGNINLLKKVRDEIVMNPESHNQAMWFCGTTMCIAGHAAVLSGRAILKTSPGWDNGLYSTDGDYPVNAAVEAERALDLSDAEYHYLFYCMNNEASIKRMDQLISLWEEGKVLEDITLQEWIEDPDEDRA